ALTGLFLLIRVMAAAQVPGAAAPKMPPTRPVTYPAHTVAFAGDVTGIPDLVYASYEGVRSLTMDLYLPRGSAHPFVLFLHGGSFHAADSRFNLGVIDLPAMLASMAAHGYVVASINYRLTGEAKFPAQLQDVKAAIKFLRANASDYGLDPARG